MSSLTQNLSEEQGTRPEGPIVLVHPKEQHLPEAKKLFDLLLIYSLCWASSRECARQFPDQVSGLSVLCG